MIFNIFSNNSTLKIKEVGKSAILLTPFTFKCGHCGTLYEDTLSSGNFGIEYRQTALKVHQTYSFDVKVGRITTSAECIGCGYDIMLNNLVLFNGDSNGKAIIYRFLTDAESKKY